LAYRENAAPLCSRCHAAATASRVRGVTVTVCARHGAFVDERERRRVDARRAYLGLGGDALADGAFWESVTGLLRR
jgi:hypothetical protein